MTQQWTQTPPTEPGWYWVYEPNSQEWVIKHIINSGGELVFSTGVKLAAATIREGVRWDGPITPPEPPEEK